MNKIVLILASLLLFAIGAAWSQTSGTHASQPELRVAGDVQAPLQLTVSDLRKMPRKTLSLVNPHSQKKETYEGVLLEDILHKAGVTGGVHLRGKTMLPRLVGRFSAGWFRPKLLFCDSPPLWKNAFRPHVYLTFRHGWCMLSSISGPVAGPFSGN